MLLEIWVLYLIATIGLSLTPGPNGLLALTHGATHGMGKSIFTITGGVTGFILLMAISMAGMGALLLASHQAFMIAKWIGAGYLVYLGIKIWRMPISGFATSNLKKDKKKPGNFHLFSQGFLVAVSNPKVIIFFAAFLPQFIDTNKPQLLQFVILALTFAICEFMVELILAGSAMKLIPWLGKHSVEKWFNRSTGALFILMGGILAGMNRSI